MTMWRRRLPAKGKKIRNAFVGDGNCAVEKNVPWCSKLGGPEVCRVQGMLTSATGDAFAPPPASAYPTAPLTITATSLAPTDTVGTPALATAVTGAPITTGTAVYATPLTATSRASGTALEDSRDSGSDYDDPDESGETSADAVEFPDMPMALRTLLDRYGDLTALQARGIVHGFSEEQKVEVRGYFLNKPEVHAEFLPDINDLTRKYGEEELMNDFKMFLEHRDDDTVKEFFETRLPSVSLEMMYFLVTVTIGMGYTKSLNVILKLLPPNCELVDDRIFEALLECCK
jgi:hypothetical protein